jgi:hypothetical protein
MTNSIVLRCAGCDKMVKVHRAAVGTYFLLYKRLGLFWAGRGADSLTKTILQLKNSEIATLQVYLYRNIY